MLSASAYNFLLFTVQPISKNIEKSVKPKVKSGIRARFSAYPAFLRSSSAALRQPATNLRDLGLSNGLDF